MPTLSPRLPQRAVVFDLDGTLIDSAEDLADALNALLAEEGLPALGSAAVKGMVGDGAGALVQRGFTAASGRDPGAALPALTERFVARYHANAVSRTRPYPGVPETLRALRDQGVRLGICTNKPAVVTRRILEALALAPLFDAVLGGDGVARRKPHPDHLHAALEQLKAAPAEAAMVGDSPNDVAAARGARVPVVAVAYGYTRVAPEALGADLVIGRFEALPDALRRLPPAVQSPTGRDGS
jgi:phosphoglycolate phosphatase